MEATAWRHGNDEAARMIDQLPAHVVAALDHLTLTERNGVLAAISTFSRHEREGTAIPGPEPLYLLWAAPEMCVIVRRATSEGLVEVEDVVRPATLRAFAAAHAS